MDMKTADKIYDLVDEYGDSAELHVVNELVEVAHMFATYTSYETEYGNALMKLSNLGRSTDDPRLAYEISMLAIDLDV